MSPQQFVVGFDEFLRNQLESLLFEPLNDFPHKSSLYAIGLDHDECSLLVGTGGGGGDIEDVKDEAEEEF